MVTHTGYITEDFITDFFSAHCDCGWGGFLRDSKETADLDLRSHYDETACENTGKDIDR